MGKLLVVLGALTIAACAGDTGPAGPAGPQGPPGLDGTLASVSFGIVVIDGAGDAELIATNAQVETSVINCYTGPSVAGPWILIAADVDAIVCGAENVGSNMLVALAGGIPGWFFLATIIVTVP